ncbi:hypothetical protein V6N11_039678 [Hibiscus sabdariffa]|uniref:RNase H type-1 domain-containing protein n=1 Tax=Hibiscus sabdariffa TaxID=183260 RepID=A0ABR2SNQ3_9ROSI
MEEPYHPPGLVILEVLFAIRVEDVLLASTNLLVPSHLYMQNYGQFSHGYNLHGTEEPTVSQSSISLVRDIATMVEKDWSVHFQWIPREANKAVDLLAKLADPLQTIVTILDQPRLL